MRVVCVMYSVLWACYDSVCVLTVCNVLCCCHGGGDFNQMFTDSQEIDPEFNYRIDSQHNNMVSVK